MPQRINPYAGSQATSATCPYVQQLRSNEAAGSAFNPYGQQAATNTGAHAPAQAYGTLPPVHQWNSRADDFALSAYRVGQTASQIAGQMRKNGYENIIVGEVVASLRRQGFINVVW